MIGHLPHRHRRDAGFNLMEVLVAIGLFAVGFAAIAAIFPTGALLQRQATDDARSRQIRDNAYAYLQAETMPASGMDWYFQAGSGYGENARRVQVREFPTGGASDILKQHWSLWDRTAPSHITDVYERDYHWVPLVRNITGERSSPMWELYVFVMRRRNDSDYSVVPPANSYPNDNDVTPDIPQLARLEAARDNSNDLRFNVTITPLGGTPLRDLFRAGDRFLCDAGNIHRVKNVGEDWIEVDAPIKELVQRNHTNTADETPNLPRNIWIAPSGRNGQRSSALQVVSFRPTGAWGGQAP